MVNHPEHYNKGKFETDDVIVETLGKYEAISYCQGNILKYIMRMWNKDVTTYNINNSDDIDY